MLSTACPKPPRGARRSELLTKRRETRTAEERTKASVRARDGRQCRVPGCRNLKAGWALNVAHLDDKGMGGDKQLIRTQAHRMLCVCFCHHQGSRGSLHSGDLQVEPQTARGTNGLCDFYMSDEQQGRVFLGSG